MQFGWKVFPLSQQRFKSLPFLRGLRCPLETCFPDVGLFSPDCLSTSLSFSLCFSEPGFPYRYGLCTFPRFKCNTYVLDKNQILMSKKIIIANILGLSMGWALYIC